MQPLLEATTHGLHLFVLGRVDIQLLRGKVSQLWVLLFEFVALLLAVALIEKIGSEEALELHDDRRQICPLEALGEHEAEQTDTCLVECDVVRCVVLDDRAELDEAFDVLFVAVLDVARGSVLEDQATVIVTHPFRFQI